MSGQARDLMEINRALGAVKEIHSLQGETIPPIQPSSSRMGIDEATFVQAEEEISIRHTIHAMRGNVAPIV